MQPAVENNPDLIREVVRGERPWSDLEALGIRIELQDNRCEVQNPRGVAHSLNVRDLAHGLIRHQSAPAELRKWAFLLEAESFLDWDEVEQHPAGELLLNALWSASFGDPVAEEALATAAQLLQDEQNHA